MVGWERGGGMNGSESLILLLGRIDERTERTEEIVSKIEDRLIQGDKRMDHGDRRMDQFSTDLTAMRMVTIVNQPNRLMLMISAMTGIAPLKEWLLGALVVFVGLKGLIAPADIKVLVLEYLK